MNNYELLIDRLREAAKEYMAAPRTMIQAADALENQERLIAGLKQILEQQCGLNSKAVDMALDLDSVKAELVDERDRFDRLSDFEVAEAQELEQTKRLLELARGESDDMTKRMIELAVKFANALEDFKRSLHGDPCDFCVHHFDDDGRCDESDLDCEKCHRKDCPCHDCRDLDKWVWRGMQKEPSHED